MNYDLSLVELDLLNDVQTMYQDFKAIDLEKVQDYLKDTNYKLYEEMDKFETFCWFCNHKELLRGIVE